MSTVEVVATPLTVHEQPLHGKVVIPSPVDVTVAGHVTSETWRGVAGATGARVDTSTVTVYPAVTAANRSLGVVSGGADGASAIRFSSPEPGALIRAVRIAGLVHAVDGHEITIRSSDKLRELGLRLVVSPVLGGADQSPVVAVPAIDPDHEVPAQLTGGSLVGGLLSVPDLAGKDFVVKLVSGARPDEFVPKQFDHGDVTLYAAPMPVGLHVDDPAGAEAYAIAGPQRETASVDLTAALNRHVAAVAAGGGDITSTITVRSDVVGKASISWHTFGAVIEREIDGRPSVAIEGAPAEIVLPPPHPGRPPLRTVADVTVTHLGMATHPISSPVPAADAGLGGPMVRDRAVLRPLPGDALRDLTVRRVGVIGWPHGRTDLTLAVLGRTATVEDIEPPSDREPPRTVWFDVGEVLVDRPVEMSLTATRGAFAWVADPEPLVRVAVAVTPDGERVDVGGRTIVLSADETLAPGLQLSGVDRIAVDSDQWCTVSLANAVMEFAP